MGNLLGNPGKKWGAASKGRRPRESERLLMLKRLRFEKFKKKYAGLCTKSVLKRLEAQSEKK